MREEVTGKSWFHCQSILYVHVTSKNVSLLEKAGDFCLYACKCLAREICIALLNDSEIPYMPATLPEQSNHTNCSFICDFVQ